tara:strand:- start:1913 stop:2236 length:324 start_codon:yes stop_codon:yes gene_type:complete
MSREVILEKIKKAEAVAASDIEQAEKEHSLAMNKIPLDQEELLSKARNEASLKAKEKFESASKDVDTQKEKILKEGSSKNSKMKKLAEANIDSAADKFIDDFLESLS